MRSRIWSPPHQQQHQPQQDQVTVTYQGRGGSHMEPHTKTTLKDLWKIIFYDADDAALTIRPQSHWFTVRNGEEIIGIAQVLFHQPYAYLYDFGLLPEWRGKGIGKYALHFLVRYLCGCGSSPSPSPSVSMSASASPSGNDTTSKSETMYDTRNIYAVRLSTNSTNKHFYIKCSGVYLHDDRIRPDFSWYSFSPLSIPAAPPLSQIYPRQ